MSELRIGLFGGSFDPIHIGHIQVAKAVSDRLHLDMLYFIPNGQSVDNKELKAISTDRLAMCKLILDHDQRWRLSDYEANQEKAVYSYKTIKHFHKRYPDATFYWIIGADRINDFPHWHEASKIVALANLIIYQRNDIDLPSHLTIDNISYPIESINPSSMHTTHGKLLAMGAHHLAIPVSSTELRESFINNPKELRHLLDTRVLKYIRQQQLYNIREDHYD
jgi:nicotinate-nucleotide adenylyltransferase